MAIQCLNVRRRFSETAGKYLEFRCMNYTIRNRDYCWRCWNRFQEAVEAHEQELELRKREEEERLAYDTEGRMSEGKEGGVE
jgi:hypothetical protein